MSKKKNSNRKPDEIENKLTLEKSQEQEASETEKTAEETSAETEQESEEKIAETDEKDEKETSDDDLAESVEDTDVGVKEKKDSDKKEIKKREKDPAKEALKAKKKAERKDKRSLKARAFRRGWFSIALVALFVAAVIIVNLIATALVEKVPALVADTTGSGSFDLSDETLDYLSKLNEKIEILILADEKTYREGGQYYIQSDSLLHKYEENSSNITLKFLDLASNPTLTSKYPDESLAQYSIIVQGDKGYKYLATTDYFDVQIDYSSYQYYIAGCKLEEAVTSAILNVTLDNKPIVSFISDITNEDYSAFMTYLENNGFETQEISPAIDEISDDTSILVLYAPNVDLDPGYVDKISAYLTNNGNYGKQLIYFPGSSLVTMPNIDSLLEEWGVEVDNGIAVENDMSRISQITYGVYLFAAEYNDSTYTEKMKNSSLPFCVFYGNGIYTHPINILDEAKAKSLLKLSEQSTVIYPAESEDNAEPTEESKPSLSVGVIATKGSTKTDTDSESESEDTVTSSSNIVVFGSNFVVTDSFLSSGMYGNASYMTSLLNTLVGRDDVGVSIETQSLKAEPLSITTAQLRVLTVLYVVILPLAILITGIVIFVKRRNM